MGAMNPQLFPQSQSSQPSSPSPVSPPSGAKPPTDQLLLPATGKLAPIERILHTVFAERLPQTSTATRDMIAEYLPWLTLIMCMVMLPVILTAVVSGGLIGILTSINTINMSIIFWASLALFTIQFGLMCFAVWHLLTHHRRGWKLLFIASLVGVVYLVPSAFTGFYNPLVIIPVLVVTLLVSFYLLYQVRSYYAE